MSVKGRTKDWRVLYNYPHLEKPGTIVCTSEGEAVSNAEKVQLRGGRADVVHVRPVSKERVTVRTFEYLPEPPEGFERCSNCGGAHEMDADGYYTKHVVGHQSGSCSQPESPDEAGPFVIALPDFRPGDKVTHLDTDFADLAEEEHELAVGTVISVEPARVRVSWPTGGYEWESPHDLRTVNVAYVHDGSRAEPVRLHIPKAPAPDTLSALALHRPVGVPDVPAAGVELMACFPRKSDSGDHRMRIIRPNGRLVTVTESATGRTGGLIAVTLREIGYTVTGLIAERSTPGDPYYAVAPTPPPERGVRAEILVGPHHAPGDAGISGRTRYVVILDERIPEKYRSHAPDPIVPGVKVERSVNYPGVLKPVAEVPGGRAGYMASGAYVSPVSGGGSWWRLLFGHDQPVKLHDRTDTWSDYDALTS